MNVVELIRKRITVGLDERVKDTWLEECVKSAKKEFEIILPANAFCDKNIRGASCAEKILTCEAFHLKAMFDLKNIFKGTYKDYVLYVFTQEMPDEIMYSIFNKVLPNKGNYGISDYPDEYVKYINDIQLFYNNNEKIEDNQFEEFGTVHRLEIKRRMWDPKRYNKKATEVRNKLFLEKTRPLINVADIIKPKINPNKTKVNNCLRGNNLVFPINNENLNEDYLTDTILQKGDIIFRNVKDIFIMNEEPKEKIYVSPYLLVIRPKNINPEALFLYLSSENSRILLESLVFPRGMHRVPLEDLKEFPVVIK